VQEQYVDRGTNSKTLLGGTVYMIQLYRENATSATALSVAGQDVANGAVEARFVHLSLWLFLVYYMTRSGHKF